MSTRKESPQTANKDRTGGDGTNGKAPVDFDFFKRYYDDILGLFCLALALMTLFGILFPDRTGGVLEYWIEFLRRYLGYGSFWIIIALTALGYWLISRRQFKESPDLKQLDTVPQKPKKIPWGRIFALEIAAIASLGLMAVIGGMNIETAESGMGGGIVGWGIASLLGWIFTPLGFVGLVWEGLILAFIFIWGIVAGTGLWQVIVRRSTSSKVTELPTPSTSKIVISQPYQPAQVPDSISETTTQKSQKKPSLPPEFRKQLVPEEIQSQKPVEPPQRDERLPGFELLVSDQNSKPDKLSINQTAGMIEKTLSEFGIPATVVGYRMGPTVTQFAVEPGFVERDKTGGEGEAARSKIRVAQIAALQRDLALALAAERLRIEAPVPGRPYVGIEVPNTRTMAVRLRAILEADAFYRVTSPLAIALGRDVSGQPVVADLATMPHLLIAGTTGSGKSVCIAAIAVCLAMNNTPDELKLVMVDPKMVELQRFKGLPHLLGEVETDVEKILAVLRWVVSEMDRRYKLLETSRSRNIETYNKKIVRKSEEKPLPRIVVMVDELADLMMSAPDQTEHNLVRLAQMARAVGIHLVIATQRPSTDVVTGLIKANFPARIAFNVTSGIDSRVIIDTVGAETLLGRGDMLFVPPEASAPIRSQGVMVTDQEIQRVIGYWNKQSDTGADAVSPWDAMLEEESVLSDRDELIDRAIEVVRGTQRASTSMLQRRLRIGYPRAARLMEELELLGVVGTAQPGGRDRDVLIDRDDD